MRKVLHLQSRRHQRVQILNQLPTLFYQESPIKTTNIPKPHTLLSLTLHISSSQFTQYIRWPDSLSLHQNLRIAATISSHIDLGNKYRDMACHKWGSIEEYILSTPSAWDKNFYFHPWAFSATRSLRKSNISFLNYPIR